MNTIIWFVLLIAVWIVLAKFILPKLGIEG